jgi:hypothetical protein
MPNISHDTCKARIETRSCIITQPHSKGYNYVRTKFFFPFMVNTPLDFSSGIKGKTLQILDFVVKCKPRVASPILTNDKT